MPAMGCLLCLVVAKVFLVACSFPFSRGFDCDFKDPNCGWTWSDGFALVTAQNPSLGNTAPSTDANNNAEGSYLYYTAGSLGKEMKVEVTSPEFKPGTKPSCYLEFYLHMYNMDQTEFKMVIEAPNVTLESGSFEGNSRHRWEKHKEMIGSVDQPFHVVLEVTELFSVDPSHLAIDDIRVVDCYDTEIEASVECGVRQFQCSDGICLDAHQVCDVTVDCVEGEDENQECGVLPEEAYCTFETGTCGWNSSKTDNSTWVRHSGVSPNKRTGPSFDHTFQNNTGVYLLARFPAGRAFGHRTTLRSPSFNPPPLYHSDKFSKYFNSCQVRFYYHKYGQYVGELRLYSVEVESRSARTKHVELWRSFGDQGDVWRKTVVSLPPITRKFYLEFSASRGVRHSDIAIDDVTLSMECFCRGIPENETSCITTEAPNVITSPMTPLTNVKNYTFGTCGARGRFGPKPEQCAEAYKDTSVQVDVGTEPGLEGIQIWTVPADGIYTLFLRGAGGGIGDGNHLRSRGSSIRVSFQWKRGEVVHILVGQKGGSACSLILGTCSHQNNITKSSLFSRKKLEKASSGGGGGGATVVYKVDESKFSKILLAVAAGGGGLSAKEQTNPLLVLNPNGMGINSSVETGSGFSGDGAGGGGGWNGTTVLPSGGQSLQEGGRGGVVCPKLQSWAATDGGFGGGGGACAGGGGGGGYRGGDASEIDNQLMNGQGGTSYLNPRGRFVFVEPGVNEGDGSAVIVPTQEGCGCEHLCVLLDLDNQTFHCVCPEGHAPGADGFSCEALIVTEMQGHEKGISTRHLVVIVLCVVVAVGVLLFFTVLGLNRYRKQQSRDLSHEPLSNPEMQLNRLRPGGGMVTEDNPIYRFGGSPCTVQDLRKVPREHLTLVKALGQGAFGEVYQGYLTDASDNSEKPVAVKTLPELSSSQAEMDFLMEALIMSKFNHPNIVSFIGVCFEKMPHFIVLELLPGGDLKSFLRECRPKPQKSSPLTLTDLLLLAMDVAKGCEYLEENHFIHRDIAARNCLLTTKDRDRVVKIADFGMARDIYRADYYRKGGKAMLPVKWMPPEAFLDGIFTSKTDVWSFGVLLWEVISLGYMPYPGRGNQEVMQLVTSGGRLEPPTNCPSPVYHIMMKCWHPLPDQRPNFFTIIERLGYCLQDPDVINAPLPVFTRPPSMERDATVMRPPDADNGGCLRVHRPDPGLLLSPGSEDYLIPMPQSTYSMTTDRTDLQSSPSLGSVDQLLELEDRSTDVSPSKPPEWGETNFMTPDTTTDVSANPLDSSVAEWNGIDNPPLQSSPDQSSSHHGQPLKKRAGGYTEVPTEEEAPSLPSSNDLNNPGKRGMPASGIKMMANRVSSIKSLDALPVALEVVNENEVGKLKTPSAASTNHSNLSLDPGALSRQLGSNPPTRYMNIDVNCNSGSGDGMGGSNSLSSTRIGSFDQNVANHNVGPFDGYAGVNPMA